MSSASKKAFNFQFSTDPSEQFLIYNFHRINIKIVSEKNAKTIEFGPKPRITYSLVLAVVFILPQQVLGHREKHNLLQFHQYSHSTHRLY